MISHLGMIAGGGELPVIIARQAYEAGSPIPTVALSADIAAQLSPYCPGMVHYGPGQVARILHALHGQAVRQVVIIGTMSKRFLFEKPRLDFQALRLLSSMPNYRDSTFFQVLSAELAREGLEVVEQTRVLHQLVAPAGVLGARRPSRREWQDIAYGYAQAKQLAAMDIGQTLVVRRQMVLAVEALEGTDAAIARGCALGQRGSVVVKVSRPQQDLRFDVPAVGPVTLQTLIAGGATVLAVEAGATLMLHLPDLVASANIHRVSLVGASSTLLQQRAARRRKA